MSFWPFGRRPQEPKPSRSAGADRPTTAGLAVVEFWTADQRVTVGMELGQDRVTDLVNRVVTIRVVPFDVPPADLSQRVDMPAGAEWADLEVGEALLIFPPPHVTDPQRRLHRPKQPVDIAIGPFEVSGAVHIPPGAQAAGFLFRQTTRFSPITGATVRDTREPGFELRADVVLVNLRQVRIIRDVGEPQPDAGAPSAATTSQAPEPAASTADRTAES